VEAAIRRRHEYPKPAIVLALYTEMGKSEILGLTRVRVDYQNRLVTLTGTKNGRRCATSRSIRRKVRPPRFTE
jgi:integrase